MPYTEFFVCYVFGGLLGLFCLGVSVFGLIIILFSFFDKSESLDERFKMFFGGLAMAAIFSTLTCAIFESISKYEPKVHLPKLPIPHISVKIN